MMKTEKFIEERGHFENNALTISQHFDEGTEFRILMLPQKSDRLYMRRLLESILNLSATVLQDSVTAKNTGLSDSHIYMLKNLGRFMGYYVGSSSFEMNELKDFDSLEFTNRLKSILIQFKSV